MYTQASANSLVWKKAIAAQKQTSLGSMPGATMRATGVSPACVTTVVSALLFLASLVQLALLTVFPASREGLARVGSPFGSKNDS